METKAKEFVHLRKYDPCTITCPEFDLFKRDIRTHLSLSHRIGFEVGETVIDELIASINPLQTGSGERRKAYRITTPTRGISITVSRLIDVAAGRKVYYEAIVVPDDGIRPVSDRMNDDGTRVLSFDCPVMFEREDDAYFITLMESMIKMTADEPHIPPVLNENETENACEHIISAIGIDCSKCEISGSMTWLLPVPVMISYRTTGNGEHTLHVELSYKPNSET